MKKSYRARYFVVLLVFAVVGMLIGLASTDTTIIIISIVGLIEFGSKGIVELYAPIVVISDKEICIRSSYRKRYNTCAIRDITGYNYRKHMPLFPYLEINFSNSATMGIPLWAMSRAQQKEIIEYVGLAVDKDS